MKQQPLKRLNSAPAKWVIRLHQLGYTDDFWALSKREIQCLQNGETFALRHLRVKLIDSGYDLLTRSYRYIHTIDTGAGCRGLLITDTSLGAYA